MENEKTVNELVIYLAHCNRKEHLATVLAMIRQQARNEQAIRDTADDVRGLMDEQRHLRQKLVDGPIDPLMRNLHNGY